MLNEFLNSEYNNAGELYGIDAEKLARIAHSATPVEKAQIVKKIAQQGQIQASRGSRKDFEKHFAMLPKHIKDELGKGNLRLSDYTIYSIKQINSKTIKMFEPQDDKEVGVRNVANAKLPKNMVMVVSGIFLLTGKNEAPTNPEGRKSIEFKSVGTVNAVCNGEFSFKANRKQLIPENQAIRCFATDNNQTIPMGYYPLDNPRLVNDDELIEFTVELGTQLNIDPDQWLYVGLVGTVTTP